MLLKIICIAVLLASADVSGSLGHGYAEYRDEDGDDIYGNYQRDDYEDSDQVRVKRLGSQPTVKTLSPQEIQEVRGAISQILSGHNQINPFTPLPPTQFTNERKTPDSRASHKPRSAPQHDSNRYNARTQFNQFTDSSESQSFTTNEATATSEPAFKSSTVTAEENDETESNTDFIGATVNFLSSLPEIPGTDDVIKSNVRNFANEMVTSEDVTAKTSETINYETETIIGLTGATINALPVGSSPRSDHLDSGDIKSEINNILGGINEHEISNSSNSVIKEIDVSDADHAILNNFPTRSRPTAGRRDEYEIVVTASTTEEMVKDVTELNQEHTTMTIREEEEQPATQKIDDDIVTQNISEEANTQKTGNEISTENTVVESNADETGDEATTQKTGKETITENTVVESNAGETGEEADTQKTGNETSTENTVVESNADETGEEATTHKIVNEAAPETTRSVSDISSSVQIKNITRTTPPRKKTTTSRTKRTTTTKFNLDVPALLAIIANLTYDYEMNLTDNLNETLLKYSIPTCETPTTTVKKGLFVDYDANATGTIVAKCFVCGLEVEKIPRNAHCADAFAGDFLPLVPVDMTARGKISKYRKYCRYADVPHYMVNASQPRSVFGRWTGGCAVRWIDLSGVYTQRTCRSRERAIMGRHFASKRMAKLEMALGGNIGPTDTKHETATMHAICYSKCHLHIVKNVENGCITSPMATLVPLSRGISLYARFHACVCTGSWCNPAPGLVPGLLPTLLPLLAPPLAYISPHLSV